MRDEIRQSNMDEAAKIAEIISCANSEIAEKFGLNRQNCSKHPSFCTTEWVEKDIDRGALYFSYIKGDITAGCVAYERADNNMAFLNRLAVLPELQRHGIGERLVGHFFNYAKKDNVENISVGIIARHHDLINWYEKLGFTKKEVKKYPHLPFDVAFMTYQLR